MAPKSRKRNAQDAPSASHVPDDTTEPTYDAIRFRSLAHQQHFFEWVQNKTPNVEVPFQLHATEFPNITAEVKRRGWHYLCNPKQGRLGITLLREFYANAKKTKRERASNPPVYISHIRGKEIDYSPKSLKASQEITHKAMLELRENQDKHQKELAAHRREYKKDFKAMKETMDKQKAQFEAANQYWHQINSKNEQKIDYLCWGVQQVNAYLKGRCNTPSFYYTV
ncbi:hypothetical protein PIB30_069671 [Stylosanthes scabra]|uniref:Putative plant transposon protein domain-containing protein n=1 Tax=Stylosanthes scabra TaxID=79078 RepID=A0ABU6RP68_9FABA|nr:hypothetical protein [Stylosanthes scabra]